MSAGRPPLRKTVDFVDTSILTNVLQVPHKCERYAEIREELIKREDSGIIFVLPTATIIETGNHIFQLKDDRERRQCAAKYVAVPRMTAQGLTPWTLFERLWSSDLIHALCDGASTTLDLVEHATQSQLGAGDLSIIVERDIYASRNSGLDVRIWTVDDRLGVWAEIPTATRQDRRPGRAPLTRLRHRAHQTRISVLSSRVAYRPEGEASASSARRSPSNAARRAPNRCGVEWDMEYTSATT